MIIQNQSFTTTPTCLVTFISHCVLVIYMYLQMHQFLDPTEEEQVVQQLEEYSRNGCVYVCDSV